LQKLTDLNDSFFKLKLFLEERSCKFSGFDGGQKVEIMRFFGVFSNQDEFDFALNDLAG
jgi:hypothetical protein